MPIFIDGHKMSSLTREQIEKIANSPIDEHGVRHIELLFNEKEDKLFCILEGPSKEAIENHHNAANLKCDFIVEAEQVKSQANIGAERLSSMGQLSARVAHDLRNPLGVIKNAVELIEMTLSEDDEKLKKRVDIIKNATEKMSRQINDVLDFVRTRPLQLEKNSLSTILETAIKSMDTKVEISIPDNDVTLNCDGKQLEVVFGNLITNAIQAMEDKGKITIRFTEDSNLVKVDFEDSGPGIEEENFEKIFDPLFTTKSGGTGLGLVSCRNIVTQHGGTISVKNNPTTFTITIPKK